ncbi:type II toxin-antitoxin system VapC family toxin [Actinomycetospora cinnamomea]|uniref:Ribonuclease VapC n=1 Tax=Actinomycetospora cinnamomea TaxID=663609 RepID=A0A2U1EVI6_9PSEU|nr:type II toxin-antitoxin system VapC family toxin [Actinomycetospora cinnamomea]PVZ03938.1 hypothetical protein C8D89_11947 [Actinomycetospora cinnamomea]
MISCDVNVLVYAYNEDGPRHADYRRWLEHAANGPEPFGLSPQVESGFVRVVTHPKVLESSLTADEAFDLLADLRRAPAVVDMLPGSRQRAVFEELCRGTSARGNAVPDAYLAALAIEHGCDWYSADRGFTRYRGLRYRHPLDAD